MPRALFSVSDKTGIEAFANVLASMGWDIVASGGTAKALQAVGIKVTPIEQLTGLPEMLGGRVKTLHPAIHAAILARDHSADMAELNKLNYAPIDLVVCNLYPFQETIARSNISLAEAIENIDIGGVTLIRAAAKNFERVTVVVDPNDYETVQNILLNEGHLSLTQRRELATKAFQHTRDYDAAIYGYLANDNPLSQAYETLPPTLTIGLTQTQSLRYGENPHQSAALYSAKTGTGPLGGTLLRGKELSYNNLLDADAAWRAVTSFTESPAVVIVKHTNPTGIAIGNTITEAFPLALASDPVSAFGGVIAVNRPVTADFVHALDRLFIEVIVAPLFDDEAIELLSKSRKNCRLLQINETTPKASIEFRSILEGVLVQQRDLGDPETTVWEVVTKRHPTNDEVAALKFAWHCVQHVKSNAIVLAKSNTTIGIGGGLSSRVDAANLAVAKAGTEARGAVMASDAFFPFADGIEAGVKAGITAIIQPGGSIRDQEVIEAADNAEIAMVFTKTRHFRH